MARTVVVGAAQMGPIQRHQGREAVVERLLVLMRKAKDEGCELVVFPELALTTFFPRWYMPAQDEVDAFFEERMPSPATQPLFVEARKLGIGFHLGYAELERVGDSVRRFNTAILVDRTGRIVGKYRKIHLPGHDSYEPWRPFQHLEKRYFEPGDLGFPTLSAHGGTVGMLICNDRRWPEAFRVLGLQGVELVLIGYNTPALYPAAPSNSRLVDYHNHLSLKAGAYQNGTWVVAVAKAGKEEGCDLIGGSCIVSPTGEIVAEARTLDDELITAECDLDRCQDIKGHIFNFARHRRPENYALISAPTPQAQLASNHKGVAK
ncbi:MAG: N-carbamoyl-D-amino-acid hydrolase [Alphaproteobacteria bacterium]|nr:N-carbamoyl-D-amino-acid hydrolase [Alphaproteobacteria bacterium]